MVNYRTCFVLAVGFWVAVAAHAQDAKEPAASVMAPVAQYLMAKSDEIALARSAAPASISDGTMRFSESIV